NAFALESLMMKLVGVDPSESKVLNAAILRGVCPAGTDWFGILGDDPGAFDSADFRLPSANVFSERMPARLTGRLNRFVSVAPRPMAGKCTRCGTCAKVCPRGAITIGEAAAEVDLKRCIRCFCCDELCEYDAIGLKKPLLVRVREWSDRRENL
ncbi:MAG TPA: 4Fe-4S binding protein, partial [Candidatus Anoxymicrobiaceae bacterium]